MTPTLVVAYDADAVVALERLRLLVGDDADIQMTIREDFDPDGLTDLLSGVGADDPFLLIHLLGPRDDTSDDDLDELVTVIETVRAGMLEAHPGLRSLRSWVIHAVGRRIDQAELHLVQRLLAGGTVRGVLVTATSSNASVAHDDHDQAAFSADAALLLRSSDLETRLATRPPSAWAFGVASVSYSAARLGQAISAFHSSQIIDSHLLASKEAQDPSHALGEVFIDDLDLTADTERVRLLAGPRGGTLLARIRMDPIPFDDIPPASWADVVTTRHDLLALRELPFISKRIGENAEDRLAELRDVVVRRLLDELEESQSLDSAMGFCEGMRRGVEHVLGELRSRRIPTPNDRTVADRDKLRRLLRWLPFGPAVALRLLAFATLALVAVGVAMGPRVGSLSGARLGPYPLGVAAAILILGATLYFHRIRTTIRVRDRLAQGLEELLCHDVDEEVLEARIDTLTRLRDWIGRPPDWWASEPAPDPVPDMASSLTEWLAWLRHHTAAVRDILGRRAVSRDLPGLISTRYAVNLPAPEDVSTRDLSEQLASNISPREQGVRAMVLALRPDVDGDSLPVFPPDVLADRWSHWLEAEAARNAWPDLEGLLAESPTAAHRARLVLETDVTPVLSHADPRVLHYLAVPGGQGGTVERIVLDPTDHRVTRDVSRRLTATFELVTDCFAAMVNVYRLNLDQRPEPTP